jgi:hypothetical protein
MADFSFQHPILKEPLLNFKIVLLGSIRKLRFREDDWLSWNSNPALFGSHAFVFIPKALEWHCLQPPAACFLLVAQSNGPADMLYTRTVHRAVTDVWR